MQYRQTLCNQLAFAFQCFATDVVVSVQQCQRDGVALQCLTHSCSQQLQWTDARVVKQQFIAIGTNQLLAQQLGNDLLGQGWQLGGVIAHEQLRLDQRIQAADGVVNALARHALLANHHTGYQGWQHQHVLDVVAIIGHQHRLFAIQQHDVT